jgi:AraC family transcriptional regulator, melibiose operon regulatory protein
MIMQRLDARGFRAPARLFPVFELSVCCLSHCKALRVTIVTHMSDRSLKPSIVPPESSKNDLLWMNDFYNFTDHVNVQHFEPMPAAHRHHEVELLYALTGEIELLVGSEVHTLETGGTLLFWAVVPHQTLSVSPDMQSAIVYAPLHRFVGWDLPQQFVQHLLSGTPIYLPPAQSCVSEVSVFERMSMMMQDPSRRWLAYLEMQVLIARMADQFVQSGVTPGTQPHLNGVDLDLVLKMTKHLTEQFAADLSADDIAGEYNYSIQHINRQFQRVYGKTMMQYLHWYRLCMAADLLIRTHRTVLDISTSTGFGSQSLFYEMFNRQFAMPPATYRRKKQRA